MGICHSFTPDGRCVSLLKILLTNHCIYDCQYCVNRSSSDAPRARFAIDEVVHLTLKFYSRNYIEGLFLSSGIIQNVAYTMEQLVAVARTLRLDHRRGGALRRPAQRQHRAWHGPEPAENSLIGFVYDVGADACGVFPPLDVLNEYLLHGGWEGGMSPGYTWEPFSISREEYDLLVEAVRTIPPESLKRPEGWWVPPAFGFDPEFEGEPESYPIYPGYKGPPRSIGRWPPGLERYFAWQAAVCGKHRARYHAELRAT